MRRFTIYFLKKIHIFFKVRILIFTLGVDDLFGFSSGVKGTGICIRKHHYIRKEKEIIFEESTSNEIYEHDLNQVLGTKKKKNPTLFFTA